MKRSDKKPLGCGICPYKTNSACHLERHLRIHTGQKPYACNMCSYKATDGGLLKRHMRIHSGEKPFTCQICGHKTAQSCSLKDHMAVHTGKKRYACDICSFQCSRIGRLRDHRLQHKVIAVKKEEPSEQSNQPQHDAATDSKSTSCKCPQCDLEFPGMPNLNRHISTAHSKSGNESTSPDGKPADLPYHCSLCSASAESLETLNTHFTRHILYRCLDCNVTFESSSELITHGPEHAEEFIFNCNKCEFKSKTRNELRGHERIHNSSQSSICTQCDFVSKSTSEFAQHLQTHTSTEMVQCNICSTKFGKTTELREHMVIHYSRTRTRITKTPTVVALDVSNIGTFHCYYCSYKSSEENQIAKHIQGVHMNPSVSSEHNSKNDNEDIKDSSKNEIPDGPPRTDEGKAMLQSLPPKMPQIDSCAKSNYGHNMMQAQLECNHCLCNSYGFHWLRSLERQFQPLTHFMNQNNTDPPGLLPVHPAKCISCFMLDPHQHAKMPEVKSEISHKTQLSGTQVNDDTNPAQETGVESLGIQKSQTSHVADVCTQASADFSHEYDVGYSSPNSKLKRNRDASHQTNSNNCEIDLLGTKNDINTKKIRKEINSAVQETCDSKNEFNPGNMSCNLGNDENSAEILLTKLRQFFNESFPKMNCPSEGDSDQSTLTASSNQDILTIEVSSDSNASDHSY